MADIPKDAVHETWDTVYAMSVELAARIEADSQGRGEQFDAMLVIPRGSYYPVNIVCRELGFRAPDLLHACIGSYQENSTERSPDFQIGQMPSEQEIRGKDILIIDEIFDTGSTLEYLINYLKKAGVGLVRSGVLHYQSGHNKSGVEPDWFIKETDKWIVYPWETSEEHGQDSKVKRNIN